MSAERADLFQYDTAFDSQRFTALMAIRGTVGFDQKLTREKTFIERQLKTDIGERLDVSKSTFVYEIRDGKLYEPGSDEPFEDVIERGMGRNPIDLPREKAERVGFRAAIQGFLADPETPDGRTVLDITPPGLKGSNYKKNYFDVHTKVDVQVVSTRYFSNLDNATYRKKILELNPNYAALLPDKPTDIDFKLNPLIIPSYLDYSNPDDLARFILRENIGMPEEKLDQIWIYIAPVVTSYVNTLVENPQALGLLETNYMATQKAAVKASQPEFVPRFEGISRMEIIYLAEEKVEVGGGGCGSGSCSTSNSSSSEVPTSEFDNIDGLGSIHFRCPSCGEINKRSLFQLVTNCQNKRCKSDEVLPPSLRKASA